ncbi:hypothetical protein Kpol_1063p2 [Vanderwaltozyma polyspora DSM 70294]|uniref:Calcineurin-like phosphoesterase domain-containing protein n=1 Tax=Vanderwaltozyma polyspora (strain ATCC 22028 / DSM 70294 / BCRC 21397 / CBS 2163 / NBRC 10782 / NRRL Y-8283 / UCD 57-17) TaxID=436907 RepID=A7TQP7_VANPO|nr:uncharacterized protein Kpol_1063p2 [Vanderwaltozyma polyspora DSM 70294]EDO15392.1 hypothetical protein Kpol_1063p2 [Vanderwaltozyma polyspora DSM 70294]
MGGKSAAKVIITVATIVSIITNIYIYTYPSVDPTKCFWRCKSSMTEYEQDILEQGGQLEKAAYFTKRYLKDVSKQLFSKKDRLSNDDDDVPEVHMLAFGDPQIKGTFKSTPYRTRLDTFGNDYFLGHIFDTMVSRLNPTHVAVMGDLFSSQWIGDSEFYNRTIRYVSRIFKRDVSLLESIKENNKNANNEYQVDWDLWGKNFNQIRKEGSPMNFDFGYSDVHSWEDNENYLFINLTGNHDIGYSGDITYQHLSRYNQLFGKDNYWVEYDLDTDHPWRIVVLNSVALEGPALQPEFLEVTWEFLYQLFERRFNGSTVLLTHVPFYKREGLCSDGPEFRFYPEAYEKEPYKSNLLRSQNHLSEDVSNRVLNLIFDNDKPGIILTGHDHEGCETIYNRNSTNGKWVAANTILNNHDLNIKEVTVKSMMGQYEGNTGIVTGQFNKKIGKWQWYYTVCPFNHEHVWWVAKVTAIICSLAWPLLLLVF